MANITNPAALLRTLIVYAICVPLAVFIGFTVVNLANSNYTDMQSYITIGVLSGILVFPLLMKWHFPLLVFSYSLPATVFFLPGRPSIYVAMVAVSLTISIAERILNRNQRFLPACGVQWPLLAMLGVVIVTAKLTGGFGLRSLGSDVYGGKKYIILIVGIVTFFAFIARPIPKKYANWYISLYFAGGLFSAIEDLYPLTPGWAHFIFYVFPPSYNSMGSDWQLGVTRLAGIAGMAGSIFFWMLARNGIRDNFITNKAWRPPLLAILFCLVFLGGFRASIIGILLISGLLFFMEKMYQTPMMLVLVLGGLMFSALLVPLASHLPYTFQRSLAFLPLNIAPEVRMDAEASTEWRLEIWQALLPEIPKYLLVGKGYAFSQDTFNESMGQDAMFKSTIDASQNALALSSDFHSGPLSIVIPFGIWGVIVWLWFMAIGFYVVWRNYRYGDEALRHINTFLFASYISKCFTFLFIFGSMTDDVGLFAGVIGLSIALNHGMKSPRPTSRPAQTDQNPGMAFPRRPALQYGHTNQ